MKIYISSSLKHRHKWRALRAAGLPVSCSWIDDDALGEWSRSWSQRLKEVGEADVLIFYEAKPGDSGWALVEVGMAIALHVPVLWVGSCDHMIQHQVTVCSSINEAIDKAMGIKSRAP